MIAWFNPVYDDVSKKVKTIYTTLRTARKLPSRTSPEFPCLFMFPISDATNTQTLDSEGTESHSDIGVQIEVYSNKSGTGEEECESIMNVADTEMLKIGFVRYFCNFLPATSENITRQVARYRATISSNLTLYRR